MPGIPVLDSIFGASKLLPLQRTYQWDVIFPFSMGGIPGIILAKYCQDVKFGDYSFSDPLTLRSGAHQQFFSGTLNIPSVTMTFIRPIPDLITDYFNAWKNLIVSPEGYYFPKNAYAKSIYVLLEDTSGIPVQKIRLVGAFPKSFPSYDFSYSSEDISKFSIEFSVDKIERIGVLDVIKSIF